MTMVVVLAIAAATCGLTWLVGWWGVLLVPLVVGLAWPRDTSARLAAFGAALGWALLLAVDAGAGRLGATGKALGGVLRAPGAALLVVTLLFALLAGWSAAAVGQEVARRVRARHTAA